MPALHRSLIKSLPVFSAMNDAELDDVIGSATALRIPKGSAVFEQGEVAKAFYVLLNGRLIAIGRIDCGAALLPCAQSSASALRQV
jgi:hypothetical protein